MKEVYCLFHTKKASLKGSHAGPKYKIWIDIMI